jgi:anti-sigma-K factor RskA
VSIERDHTSADDLAAYALGALVAEEAAELERHLAGCSHCGARLGWLRLAVNQLPGSVAQLEPPPALRARLLAEVQAELEAEGEPVGERRRAAGDRRGRWGIFWRPATALAATAVLIVGGAAGYLLRSPDPGPSSVVAESPKPGLAAATLERDGDVATLRVQRLPKLPPSQVYETWLQRDGELEPGSVFVLRRDGSADAAIPGPLEGASAVLVTREPRGGSQAPTSKPLLEATLD